MSKIKYDNEQYGENFTLLINDIETKDISYSIKKAPKSYQETFVCEYKNISNREIVIKSLTMLCDDQVIGHRIMRYYFYLKPSDTFRLTWDFNFMDNR